MGESITGRSIQPRRVYQRPEDIRLLTPAQDITFCRTTRRGARALPLPDPITSEDTVDFEPTDSEDERLAAADLSV